jgi:hypothetical protein
VADSEIKAQRWLPPEERARLEAKEQAEALALARMQQVGCRARSEAGCRAPAPTQRVASRARAWQAAGAACCAGRGGGLTQQRGSAGTTHRPERLCALTCPPARPGWLAASSQGSAFERALQQMMGGGLAGRGGLAERELGAAPSWMSGDPRSFSEEQLRQWREWQAREKAYVEERVRRQGGGPAGPCWPLLAPAGPCWPLLAPAGPFWESAGGGAHAWSDEGVPWAGPLAWRLAWSHPAAPLPDRLPACRAGLLEGELRTLRTQQEEVAGRFDGQLAALADVQVRGRWLRGGEGGGQGAAWLACALPSATCAPEGGACSRSSQHLGVCAQAGGCAHCSGAAGASSAALWLVPQVAVQLEVARLELRVVLLQQVCALGWGSARGGRFPQAAAAALTGDLGYPPMAQLQQRWPWDHGVLQLMLMPLNCGMAAWEAAGGWGERG